MARAKRPAVDFPFENETGSPIGRITWSGPYVNSPGQPLRVVNDLHFIYVTRGVCNFEDDNGIRTLGPGDMMVIVPNRRHGYSAPPGHEWDEHYIRCSGPLVDLWLSSGLIDESDLIWKLLPVDYWVDRMVQVIGDAITPDPDESLAQLGRLQILLADMRVARRSTSAYPDDYAWLSRARKLLEARDVGDRPSLQAAAEAMECGYHTFRRRFTKLSGIGPAKYRLLAQIIRARALIMQHSDIGNKELADTCGFADEFHFSKQFRNVVGISPSEYRKRCRSHRSGEPSGQD